MIERGNRVTCHKEAGILTAQLFNSLDEVIIITGKYANGKLSIGFFPQPTATAKALLLVDFERVCSIISDVADGQYPLTRKAAREVNKRLSRHFHGRPYPKLPCTTTTPLEPPQQHPSILDGLTVGEFLRLDFFGAFTVAQLATQEHHDVEVAANRIRERSDNPHLVTEYSVRTARTLLFERLRDNYSRFPDLIHYMFGFVTEAPLEDPELAPVGMAHGEWRELIKAIVEATEVSDSLVIPIYEPSVEDIEARYSRDSFDELESRVNEIRAG